MAVPKITDAKIKSWLGTTYAGRGLAYYRNGQVVGYQWSGQKLTGRVQGSEPRPYRVTIRFAGQYLDEGCSCPMGGGCKHVAALLYAAMNEKPSPAARPGSGKKAPALAAQLKQLDKADLIALVQALLDQEPALAAVVQSRLLVLGAATLPPEDLRDRVRQLVERLPLSLHDDDYGYDDDDDEYDDAAWDDLDALMEQAKTLLGERRYEAAHNLLSAVLSELMLAAGQSGGGEELRDVLDSATQHLLTCWQALPPDHQRRASALRLAFEVLAWEVSFGGSGLQTAIEKALVGAATPGEREALREWIALARRQAQTGRHDAYTRDWVNKSWTKLDQKLAGDERLGQRTAGKKVRPAARKAKPVRAAAG